MSRHLLNKNPDTKKNNGIWRGGLKGGAWRDPAKLSRDIPPISDKAIEATIAYCEYLWKRYRRLPAYLPPFPTLVGFQTHHVDTEFYRRYYHSQALRERHREHLERWHPLQTY